jgi:hypothetical protein
MRNAEWLQIRAIVVKSELALSISQAKVRFCSHSKNASLFRIPRSAFETFRIPGSAFETFRIPKSAF